MRRHLVARVVLPLSAAVLVVVLVLSTWAARLRYPYDLEWMEGGMLAHAWRVDHGLPIYAPPSADFVPYIYPPGYTWVVAALGEIVGLSPTLGRLVSIVGTVGAAGSLWFAIRRLGGDRVVAAATAAVFLGTYPGGGAFFDLVRPDGLCLGLTGWALALALVPGPRAAVGSGLLLALGFLVKQNVAAFGLPLVVVFGYRDGWRVAAAFAAASMGPALLAVGALEATTHGWFLKYLVDLPSSHEILWDAVYQATPREWGNPLPVAIGAITAAAVWVAADTPGPVPKPVAALAPVLSGMLTGAMGTYAPPPPDSNLLNIPSAVSFFAIGAIPVALAVRIAAWVADRRPPSWPVVYAVGVGAVAMGFAAWMRGHVGGFLNVHLPAFYVLSLGFGWTCLWAARRWPGPVAGSVAGVVLAAQLGWAAARFGRSDLVPTLEDYALGAKVVSAIEKVDGPVLSPFAAWLPVYAGKPPSLHYQGVWDLDLSTGPYHDQVDVVRDAVRDHKWAAIVAGNQRFPYKILDFYQPSQTLVEGRSRGLMPKSGFMARPEKLLLPK